MNIRRERTHQCGLTNIDFKTKGDSEALAKYKPDLKYTNFGTMSKTAFKASTATTSFNMTKQKTGMHQPYVPDPKRQTTEQFYATQGKRLTAPAATFGKRATQLEADRWNDNVFTGDTANFQADLTGKVKRRVNKLGMSLAGKHKLPGLDDPNQNKTQRDKSKSALDGQTRNRRNTAVVKPTTFSKIDVHACADQETQLVLLDNRKTLEGKVNLKKVRDIRRAIRRRYATRKNASKLFQAWDTKSKKKIDTEDIVHMVNKIGIKINSNEAHVLLKSADIDGDDALSMKEFINLIHSDNEAFVDLKTLANDNEDVHEKDKHDEIENTLQKGVSNAYENKLNNQLRFFMQKSVQTIARDCLNEDEVNGDDKTYQIDKKKLKTILKHRLNLPEMFKNDQDRIDKIVDEYTTAHNTDAVDYKIMLEDIRSFNYNIESSGAQSSRVRASPREESETSDPYEAENQKFTVLDIQKVPYPKEVEIQSRSSKLNRMLKKRFKTKEAFTHHLTHKVDVDKNGTIDLNEFKSLILTTFKNEIETSVVGKKDIEAFLSNFVYNKYGHTAIDEVAPRVFASAEEFNRIIDHFKRPKPPPSKVNGNLEDANPGDIKDKFYQQRIKTLADKIVNKALDATHNKFQCFKSFDMDDDGYISYKDFADKVKKMEISASNDEIMTVIKVIDDKKNGFIDYRQFMQHFTPNLPDIMEDNLPYLKNKKLLGQGNGNTVPGIGLLQSQINRSKSTNKTLMSVTNEFKASSNVMMNLKPSTRFSATPIWKDTFTSFHMDHSSGGYISEQDRFRKTSNSLHVKNQFQHEDKARQTKINENRISKKREVFNAFDHKAYNNDIFADSMDQNKLIHKAAMVQNYERTCHSKVI
jgi:Ca2+-binding EF-hand superfamily protein